MVYGSDFTTRSGSPNCFESCQTLSLGHCFTGGRSFLSPSGAPKSTHFAMVLICASLSDISLLKWRTPYVLSMCQGGMFPERTRSLIDFAQGLDSSKVTSDMGAAVPAR